MSQNLIEGMVTIATAIIGVAIISVLVSRNANTAGVVQAAGSALATDIGAAVSPVTGGTSSLTNYSLGNLSSTGFVV